MEQGFKCCIKLKRMALSCFQAAHASIPQVISYQPNFTMLGLIARRNDTVAGPAHYSAAQRLAAINKNGANVVAPGGWVGPPGFGLPVVQHHAVSGELIDVVAFNFRRAGLIVRVTITRALSFGVRTWRQADGVGLCCCGCSGCWRRRLDGLICATHNEYNTNDCTQAAGHYLSVHEIFLVNCLP